MCKQEQGKSHDPIHSLVCIRNKCTEELKQVRGEKRAEAAAFKVILQLLLLLLRAQANC